MYRFCLLPLIIFCLCACSAKENRHVTQLKDSYESFYKLSGSVSEEDWDKYEQRYDELYKKIKLEDLELSPEETERVAFIDSLFYDKYYNICLVKLEEIVSVIKERELELTDNEWTDLSSRYSKVNSRYEKRSSKFTKLQKEKILKTEGEILGYFAKHKITVLGKSIFQSIQNGLHMLEGVINGITEPE